MCTSLPWTTKAACAAALCLASVLALSCGEPTSTQGPEACATTGSTLFWPLCSDSRASVAQGYAEFNSVGNGKYHSGFDISAPMGTPVHAAGAGSVIRFDRGALPGDNHCMGNVVIIDHSFGASVTGPFSLYAHLQSIVVANGTSVAKGEEIGTVGNTGAGVAPGCLASMGAHLHFEVKANGVLGSATNDGPYWGYTGDGRADMANHPDQFLYHNPVMYLEATQAIAPISVQVTSEGQGRSLFLGPANYPTTKTTVGAEDRFTAIGTSAPTSNPACSQGWYEIRAVDGSYFSVGGSGSIPEAWICRGNGGQGWVTPVAAIDVAAADRFGCAVKSGGAAYCWGYGVQGQLGNGTTTSSSSPQAVSGSLTFSTVAANGSYPAASQYVAGQVCALTPGGAAYCWGSNQFGQLGNGSTSATTTPSAVSGGLTFSSVSVGVDAACGVTPSGGAYCWGRNYYGQLGNGTQTFDAANPNPVQVSGGQAFSSISAGGGTTCGVTTAGAAYCWGEGEHGELGTGTTLPPGGFYYSGQTTPVPVSGGLTFRSVSVGSAYSCGVTTSNAAYCWGNNGDGQLGTSAAIQSCPAYGGGSYPCAKSPVPVAGGLRFTSVSAFGNHACGTTDTGAAYCWGYNGTGALGTGDLLSTTTPRLVSGGLVFSTVKAGYDHTCGITTSGATYCWGKNVYGELGNGSMTDSAVPVRVSAPL